MPAPSLETLFDPDPQVEAAWKHLLEARGIRAYMQTEVDDLKTPRADIQFRLGKVTGHRFKHLDGKWWYDAWNFALTIRLTTNAVKKTPADASISAWKARVRMIGQTASAELDDLLLPYHVFTQIQEAGSTPTGTTEDDCHVCEITFSGLLSIRSNAWPEAAPV